MPQTLGGPGVGRYHAAGEDPPVVRSAAHMTPASHGGCVAVTGSRGRLGSALVTAFRPSSAEVVAWSRPDYDLGDAALAAALRRRASERAGEQYRWDIITDRYAAWFLELAA